jgi:hypothetical protein
VEKRERPGCNHVDEQAFGETAASCLTDFFQTLASEQLTLVVVVDGAAALPPSGNQRKRPSCWGAIDAVRGKQRGAHRPGRFTATISNRE